MSAVGLLSGSLGLLLSGVVAALLGCLVGAVVGASIGLLAGLLFEAWARVGAPALVVALGTVAPVLLGLYVLSGGFGGGGFGGVTPSRSWRRGRWPRTCSTGPALEVERAQDVSPADAPQDARP